MTDPKPYRDDRSVTPAEGPAQTVADEDASLPPGSRTRADHGQRGDVDRAEPYRGDPTPLRMAEAPFPQGDADPVHPDDLGDGAA